MSDLMWSSLVAEWCVDHGQIMIGTITDLHTHPEYMEAHEAFHGGENKIETRRILDGLADRMGWKSAQGT